MALLDTLLGLLYPGRQYGVRSVTRTGVPVRSRAEQSIAHYFDSIGLRYEYERELRAGFWIFTRKVSCPDFYLPEYDVYVEYWGLLNAADEHDRSKYERSMKSKKANYQSLGIKLISLYPDNLKSLDPVFRQRFRNVTGFELPTAVR